MIAASAAAGPGAGPRGAVRSRSEGHVVTERPECHAAAAPRPGRPPAPTCSSPPVPLLDMNALRSSGVSNAAAGPCLQPPALSRIDGTLGNATGGRPGAGLGELGSRMYTHAVQVWVLHRWRCWSNRQALHQSQINCVESPGGLDRSKAVRTPSPAAPFAYKNVLRLPNQPPVPPSSPWPPSTRRRGRRRRRRNRRHPQPPPLPLPASRRPASRGRPAATRRRCRKASASSGRCLRP